MVSEVYIGGKQTRTQLPEGILLSWNLGSFVIILWVYGPELDFD
ncbi:unnamed protein product [Moneuplotes crassus]|uniref:Uncharacterized protein n=1 Tax=Euplotes crassus TaxID=5936 RepID=A0AAD2CYI3_EUPCR|nr:unnamed protein product [Moneuplotes crassus]